MKAILLLGLLVLLTICPAGAQTTSPGQGQLGGIGPAAPLQIGSVAVLRHLFRQNRRSSRFGVLLGGYESVVGVNALVSDRPVSKAVGGPLIGVSVANAVFSIVRWSRYSQRREEEAVLQLQHGKSLPRYAQGPYIAALGQVKKYLR